MLAINQCLLFIPASHNEASSLSQEKVSLHELPGCARLIRGGLLEGRNGRSFSMASGTCYKEASFASKLSEAILSLATQREQSGGNLLGSTEGSGDCSLKSALGQKRSYSAGNHHTAAHVYTVQALYDV